MQRCEEGFDGKGSKEGGHRGRGREREREKEKDREKREASRWGLAICVIEL